MQLSCCWDYACHVYFVCGRGGKVHLCMCLSLCVSHFFVHIAIAVAQSSSIGVMKSQGGGVILRIFFPTDNALYIWDTYKNGWTNQDAIWDDDSSGPYMPCVRSGTRSTRVRGNFGGKRSSHCKPMGHSTVSCAKKAEPIEMLLWMQTRVELEVQITQGERAIFGAVWAIQKH